LACSCKCIKITQLAYLKWLANALKTSTKYGQENNMRIALLGL
jgi:hypothetical protein